MPGNLVADCPDEQRVLHVFDLPQLYTKPSLKSLLDALGLLLIKPPSWDATSPRKSSGKEPPRTVVDPEGVTKYLTTIVASPLHWLDKDEDRETIWETASLRLSERSGRTAMSAMSRTFRISSPRGPVEISIHEPALTADNLGLKTWAASFLLSKRLESLQLSASLVSDRPSVLELGSGTGLVGIAAAHVLGTSVVLTDLPEILPNLVRNVESNREGIFAAGGRASTATLDWTYPDVLASTDAEPMPSSFPVILAADSIYSDEHPAMLVSTVQRWLSLSSDARVAVELPVRSGYAAERDDFRERMQLAGLTIVTEGFECGYDDWGCAGDDGELQEIECWWSVWGWKSP